MKVRLLVLTILIGVIWNQAAQQAAVEPGNNWSDENKCFLSGALPVCTGCKEPYCDVDEYYPYVKYSANNPGNAQITKCVAKSACEETADLDFGDTYRRYWCAEQCNSIYIYIYIYMCVCIDCQNGWTWAVLDGTKSACLRGNPADTSKPCFEGTEKKLTLDGKEVTTCEMTEAQFWTAWERTLPPDCDDVSYWSGGECATECPHSRYRNRVWGGGRNYLYNCSNTKTNDGLQVSYIQTRYIWYLELLEHVKQTYPVRNYIYIYIYMCVCVCVEECPKSTCKVLYAKNEAGETIWGHKGSYSSFPDGKCPSTAEMKTIDGIEIEICTLSYAEVVKYNGKSTDNCGVKEYDEVGRCEYCPPDKPYGIWLHATDFHNFSTSYMYDCSNTQPSGGETYKEDYGCMRMNYADFKGRYQPVQWMCGYMMSKNY